MTRRIHQLAGISLVVGFACGVAAPLTLADVAPADDPPVEDSRAQTLARGDAYGFLMRALFAARRGEFRAAADEIRKAIKLQPESPEVYMEGAALFRSMGRQTDGSRLARQALEIAPDYVPAMRFLADQAADRAMAANADSRVIREALDLYDQLADAEALDEQALRKQANLRMLIGDLDGAIASAQALVIERPGDPDVTRMLYRLLVHARREAAALQVLLHYIGKHPNDAAMIDDADRLANKLEAWPTVVDEFNAMAATRDGANRAQGLKGQALLRLGRIPEATEALERALSIDSTDTRGRLRLVFAYRNLGRLADAAMLARGLVDEAPGDSMRQLVLAQILDQQRDVPGALDAYGNALLVLTTGAGDDGWSDRDQIRRRIAQLHVQSGQLEAARRMQSDLEQPATPDSVLLAAEIAVAAEDWNAARAAAKTLRETQQIGEAARVEAAALMAAGRWLKAEGRFRESIEHLGPWMRYVAAATFHEMGQAARGEALLREAIGATPDDPAVYFDLGRYLYLDDRFDEAEALLVKTFELEPRHAPALNFLGYGLAERDMRLDEALALIERALAVDPWDGAYLDSLGWVYYQMGQFENARSPLERAAREFPSDPVILDHLGDVYAKTGDYRLAVAAWNRALEAGSTDEETIRIKISRLPEHGGTDPAADRPRSPSRPLNR